MANILGVGKNVGYVVPYSYSLITYTGAHECLGDVIYMSLFGQPFVVLNSIDAARDLLDKRGSNYSSRPKSVLFEDL